MAVVDCAHCGTTVNALTNRCPVCGAEPRTGEGAVDDAEMMAALRDRAARREAAEGGLTDAQGALIVAAFGVALALVGIAGWLAGRRRERASD